jgi:putative variant cofactor biosynthesis B12-binding/radical SAM domain protein 1
MKVLLVQSYLGANDPIVLPLGLAILAKSLPEHEVEIFDMNIIDEPFRMLGERIKRFDPDIVGISIRNIDSTNKRKVVFYYRYLKPTIQEIIKAGRRSKIVLGGAGFSMFAKRIMEDLTEADFGVYLEGEETFHQLLKNLDHPEAVKGLFYRVNKEIHFTGERERQKFSNFMSPRWDMVNIQKYAKVSDGIGIETKRGCTMACAYCPYPFLDGANYRLKPVSQVLGEIEEISKKYSVKEFLFTDSVFNIPLSHAENICRRLITKRLNVRWSAWFNEKNITEDFLLLAQKAGCDNFIFSPDGFSDTVLEKIQKNLNKEDILRVYRMLKDVPDVHVCYNFFKNPPGQKLSTAIEMIKFIVKAKLELGKKRVSFELSSLRIEPHTQLHKIAEEEGSISNKTDALFPIYYSNPKTRYVEKVFNFLLWLKGK